jgi:hypothetical protein
MSTPSIIVYRNPLEQMFWESEYIPMILGVMILFMVILVASVHVWDWILVKILVKTNRKFMLRETWMSYVPIWFSVLATYLLIRFVF